MRSLSARRFWFVLCGLLVLLPSPRVLGQGAYGSRPVQPVAARANVEVAGPFARTAGQTYAVRVAKWREERMGDAVRSHTGVTAQAQVAVQRVTSQTVTFDWAYDDVTITPGQRAADESLTAALLGIVPNLRMVYQGGPRGTPQGLTNRTEVQRRFQQVLTPALAAVPANRRVEAADLQATLASVDNLLQFVLAEPALLHALDGLALETGNQTRTTSRPGPFADQPVPATFLLVVRPDPADPAVTVVTRTTRLDRTVLADQALALVGRGQPGGVDPAMVEQVLRTLRYDEVAVFRVERATGQVRRVVYDKTLGVGDALRIEHVEIEVLATE